MDTFTIVQLVLMFFCSSEALASFKQCKKIDNGFGMFHLDCSDRRFTEIPKDRPIAAKYCDSVDFRNNKISVIEKGSFDGFSQLTQLDLGNNTINDIQDEAFAKNPNLVSLILPANEITKISRNMLKGLKWITELDLTYNKISNIADGTFNDMGNLKWLSLSGNRLAKINKNMFRGLKSMEELSLAANEIKVIPDETFNGMSKIFKLELMWNKLEKFGDKALDGLQNLEYIPMFSQRSKEKLILPQKIFRDFIARYQKTGKELSLDITRCSFNCTCDMYWLIYVIHNKVLPDGTKFTPFGDSNVYYKGAKCGSIRLDSQLALQSLRKKCQKSL